MSRSVKCPVYAGYPHHRHPGVDRAHEGMRRSVMDLNRRDIDIGRPALVMVTYSGLGDLAMALPLFAALRPHFKVLPVIQPQHRDLARLLLDDGLLEDYLPIEHHLSFRSDPMGHVAIYRALAELRPEVVLIYGKRMLALAAYLGFLRVGRSLFCDPTGFVLPATGSFEALMPTGSRVGDYQQFAKKLGVPAWPERIEFSREAVARMPRICSLREKSPSPVGEGTPTDTAQGWSSYAVVAPWASTAARSAPRRFFRECIEIITTEARLPVVVTGTSEHRVAAADLLRGLEHHAVKNLVGATSLRALLGLLAGARFLLSNDSGSLHLAQLVGTPSLIAFGPTAPQTLFFAPPQIRLTPIQLGLPCSPCEYSSHRYRCPGPFLQCLNDLGAAQTRDLLLKAAQDGKTGNP